MDSYKDYILANSMFSQSSAPQHHVSFQEKSAFWTSLTLQGVHAVQDAPPHFQARMFAEQMESLTRVHVN